VLEVSENYSIVLPVILANTIAYLISRTLQPIPILDIFTHQDGLDLPSMEEQREESNLRLEDALHPVAVLVLQGSETLAAAAATLAQYGGEANDASPVLVHCSDGLWYAATRREIESVLTPPQPDPANPTTQPPAAAADPRPSANQLIDSTPPAAVQPAAPGTADPSLTLEQRLGAERTPVLFPDLPLASALPHFRRWPLLPVTNRAVRGALEGTVSLEDVLKRYQQR
jgi:CIC family chloride channel protein